ncbi:divergent PAP2 family protein [Anaerotignum neopropionicum]|uniref:Divergent PAP2 family protein n=1 Tax=Anaerotignum neopropionicum TaxID=36847 RepID=A0A136WEY5_9FIRM|nr:divergent PAP2 family protein [Anaerotignum neopropionicum]KXL53055.1 divergent PAP2 family protein [Anaerotignum neopropionicum]
MGFTKIAYNVPLWAAIISWAIAQSSKIILVFITEKRFDATRIVGTGGMPSSHTALVMALAVSIGKYNGFDSPFFALALIFCFVVMYDAAGIRRAAGKQAEIINLLILDHELPDMEKLKELLGHTPLEVFVGGILGIVVGIWI